MSQLRDTRSYETQIIDAVRSVNRALGGSYGSSSAIYKSDYNQYEVQLIDAIKGISRTLSGSGLSVYGGADGDPSGFVTQEQFSQLTRRVQKLEDESFFRLVDGNVTLKSEYSNLWVPGWLAAGGVGSGSGGGGSVDHLYDIGDVTLTTLTDGQALVWDATNGYWTNGAGGGGGSGTVTSVKVGNTAYNPDINGVVSLPAYPSALSQLSTDSTHRVVTDTQISTWNGKQDAISDLATIRAGAALGATAIQTETDPTVPSWAKQSTPELYVGTTRVQTSSAAQDLTGILSVQATSSAASKFEWDATNGAWHFIGNLYADGWVAAGGVGSGGGGGSFDLSRMWASLTNSTPDAYAYTQINASHLPSSLKNPYALTFGSQTYDGSAAKTITASDLGALTQSSGDGRYLRLSGGTMTGDIVLNGADIEPSTDDTCYLGGSTRRFNNGFIRNIYTSYLEFVDGSTRATRGNFSIGDGYASIIISGSPSNTNYMFYDGAGFFHGGNGVVPCGRSDHRWSEVYSNEVDIKGGLVFRNSSGNKTGYISAQDGYLFFQAGTDIESSYKQLTFNPSLGLYPESSGLALGYNGTNYRWSAIYGVNADLTGDLTLASTSHIDLGPLRIEYDSTNKALHVTKASNNDTVDYGLYADGFVAAGGIGSGGAYITYVRCSSQSQYDAITTKSETTMYFIGDPATKIYLGTVLLFSEN